MTEPQHTQQPIGSGFTAASTAEDVIKDIDLSGKTAIVTGGYSGLGLETVRVLRLAGARVIVPARDHDRAAAAMQHIEGAEVWRMDLLDPASIDAFATRFLATGQPLHMLVNSAGIMATPALTLDARGHELQFATNHLGHFQLTLRLWPALRQAQGARIVSVSSWGHRYSPVVFDDVDFAHREYQPFSGYGQSKTANILFAVAADARGKADGIRAFSLHPGSILATNLGRHISTEQLRAFGVIDEQGNPVIDPARQLKTLGQGAATQVWCATSPQLNGIGGLYCENVEVAGLVVPENDAALNDDSNTRNFGVMPYAVDPQAAERLWTLSEQLTGVSIA